jgi:hypothetical protein
MPRRSPLEKQWDELMALCEREQEFRAAHTHPKLLTFISSQIDQLAAGMGFSARQIKTREFRAQRSGGRITGIISR